MMDAKALPDRKEQGIFTVGEQHLLALHSTRRRDARARNGCQPCNLFLGHRQLDRLPPSCHDATPHSINHKRGILRVREVAAWRAPKPEGARDLTEAGLNEAASALAYSMRSAN
jgi:hypothetical protein